LEEQKIGNNTDNVTANGQSWILKSIIVAIVLGALVGGLLPEFGVKFSLLGQMFLNGLMMIVVPLVMCSMISGITGLGDIRKLGAIGSRTILYYMITTGLSVFVGLILVNLIQPGKGIKPGEEHPDFHYELKGPDNRALYLKDKNWERTVYNENYLVILNDQGVEGQIESITENIVKVKFWQPRNKQGIVYLETGTEGVRPFFNKNGQLVSAEPELNLTGKSVSIILPAVKRITGKSSNIGDTIKSVLVGDKAQGNSGLIPKNIFTAMANMEILPLIFFSLLIGAALSVLGQKGKIAIDLIESLNTGLMKIIDWIMFVAPFGIFGLIASRIGEAGGFQQFLPELFALGKYCLTVLTGLFFHGVITLPLILYIFSRRNPWVFFSGMSTAVLNAFSTASSSATLPLTIEGVEKKNNISNRTASFVLPLGATVNMDGTALYEAVAAMFIAQVYGISLGPVEQIIIFCTATLAAIGAAGIPQAGLVTMVIVLKAVNLPVEGIGLILTIDWLLDRFRTAVNVWGDSIGAAVVENLEINQS